MGKKMNKIESIPQIKFRQDQQDYQDKRAFGLRAYRHRRKENLNVCVNPRPSAVKNKKRD